MDINHVNSQLFRNYGQVLDIDFHSFLEVLDANTPMPEDGFIYEPSIAALESHPIFTELQNSVYGGMPVQLGYCNGRNSKLNCLEYHKGSEVCIMLRDTILLLGLVSQIDQWRFDTSNVRAFLVPAGTGIELYATTLHYAPCHVDEQGYKVANCLPKGTNYAINKSACRREEDKLLMASNKWLLSHADAPESLNGAYVGIIGENIDIASEIR